MKVFPLKHGYFKTASLLCNFVNDKNVEVVSIAPPPQYCDEKDFTLFYREKINSI